MLSIGNTIPGSGLADTMIRNYKEVIAADYAFVFLSQFTNVGTCGAAEAATDSPKQQRPRARHCARTRSKFLDSPSSRSSRTCTQKVASVSSVASDLERLERNLRANMSAHVLDMLGHAHAAFGSPCQHWEDAAMWEIYAYHNTESLFGIFNAVAAIMGSGTYLSAIAAVAFCGFVAAMVAYMFAPEKLQGWKWIGRLSWSTASCLCPA